MARRKHTGKPASKKTGPRKTGPGKVGKRTPRPLLRNSGQSEDRVPDHRSKSRRDRHSGSGAGPRGSSGAGNDWIYGTHAVLAALANPQRRFHRLLVNAKSRAEADPALASVSAAITPEYCDRDTLEGILPPGAVHQGMALLADPLAEFAIEDIIAAEKSPNRPEIVVVLDQATDPRNIGAVLRSAAAFGAMAVIVQTRHAPGITGTLAKAASGALERVPLVRVTNIARALETLKKNRFWCVGLDGTAKASLAATDTTGPVALVLGAEGSGLRRLVRESCDALARIPISADVESLNLSNAAAISLYELARTRDETRS